MSARVTTTMRPDGHIAMVIRPTAERHLGQKMQRIAAVARQRAPVGKTPTAGTLRNSIRVVARDAGGRFASPGSVTVASAAVVVSARHAGFVVRGTSPHVIRSTGPWPLRNAQTGQVFGPVVNHPGTRPNNFLDVALRSAGGFRG